MQDELQKFTDGFPDFLSKNVRDHAKTMEELRFLEEVLTKDIVKYLVEIHNRPAEKGDYVVSKDKVDRIIGQMLDNRKKGLKIKQSRRIIRAIAEYPAGYYYMIVNIMDTADWDRKKFSIDPELDYLEDKRIRRRYQKYRKEDDSIFSNSQFLASMGHSTGLVLKAQAVAKKYYGKRSEEVFNRIVHYANDGVYTRATSLLYPGFQKKIAFTLEELIAFFSEPNTVTQVLNAERNSNEIEGLIAMSKYLPSGILSKISEYPADLQREMREKVAETISHLESGMPYTHLDKRCPKRVLRQIDKMAEVLGMEQLKRIAEIPGATGRAIDHFLDMGTSPDFADDPAYLFNQIWNFANSLKEPAEKEAFLNRICWSIRLPKATLFNMFFLRGMLNMKPKQQTSFKEEQDVPVYSGEKSAAKVIIIGDVHDTLTGIGKVNHAVDKFSDKQGRPLTAVAFEGLGTGGQEFFDKLLKLETLPDEEQTKMLEANRKIWEKNESDTQKILDIAEEYEKVDRELLSKFGGNNMNSGDEHLLARHIYESLTYIRNQLGWDSRIFGKLIGRKVRILCPDNSFGFGVSKEGAEKESVPRLAAELSFLKYYNAYSKIFVRLWRDNKQHLWKTPWLALECLKNGKIDESSALVVAKFQGDKDAYKYLILTMRNHAMATAIIKHLNEHAGVVILFVGEAHVKKVESKLREAGIEEIEVR